MALYFERKDNGFKGVLLSVSRPLGTWKGENKFNYLISDMQYIKNDINDIFIIIDFDSLVDVAYLKMLFQEELKDKELTLSYLTHELSLKIKEALAKVYRLKICDNKVTMSNVIFFYQGDKCFKMSGAFLVEECNHSYGGNTKALIIRGLEKDKDIYEFTDEYMKYLETEFIHIDPPIFYFDTTKDEIFVKYFNDKSFTASKEDFICQL